MYTVEKIKTYKAGKSSPINENIDPIITENYKETAFSHDVYTYVYRYTDVADMAEEIKLICEGDDQTVFFDLNDEMTEIEYIDCINDSMITDNYNDMYVFNSNSFEKYSDFLKELDN